MDCPSFCQLLIFSCLAVALFDGSGTVAAAGCSDRLRLRASEAQIDLSQLSAKQLQLLVKQLTALQHKQKEQNQSEEAQPLDDQELESQNLEDLQQYEDDHRGSSRPWNRLQRIIRRQLVRIPKRYLKKLLRQFGLARNLDVSNVRAVELLPQPQDYYLIPLE
ncbi:uncharacterized protein LOC117590439 [Drosophila guanche]|uniref:Uncharacterized protein n=1 Tax=Drosophila guanche TaxID=7266 RepID=A0A3B0K5F0_DROGU|nr:uncharacterized protein LOC117590439 [Drosophila guanche]SPP88523.1 Hypothetical predicted protein [Drosophila guanche]